MAIELPTTRIGLRAESFRHDRPILSGEHNDDSRFGFRGIVAESNHAYAYRTATLASAREYDDSPIFETTATTATDATGTFVVELGADVANVRVVADVQHDGSGGGSGATVTLSTSDATADASASSSGSTREQKTATIALTRTSGAALEIKLQLHVASGGGTAKLYGYAIQEVPLIAADIP
jgi:microcystin degradation protein MlrC